MFDANPGFRIVSSSHSDAPPHGVWTSLNEVNVVHGEIEAGDRSALVAEGLEDSADKMTVRADGLIEMVALAKATNVVCSQMFSGGESFHLYCELLKL